MERRKAEKNGGRLTNFVLSLSSISHFFILLFFFLVPLILKREREREKKIKALKQNN